MDWHFLSFHTLKINGTGFHCLEYCNMHLDPETLATRYLLDFWTDSKLARGDTWLAFSELNDSIASTIAFFGI